MICAILIGRLKSTGLPGKNTMTLLGHPMAWWPLDAARHCPEVDEVYISTDDQGIAALAPEFNASVIDRPASLATDTALGEDVFVHAHHVITDRLTDAGALPELYVLLMANAVTVSPRQISAGIQALRSDSLLDSAVTVSRYNMWSPLRARKIDPNGLLQPFVPFETFGDPETLDCDRDSQGDVWFADMGVSVVRPKNLDHLRDGLLPQKWMGQKIYPIRSEAGLDVDYDFQVTQAEWWLKKNRL